MRGDERRRHLWTSFDASVGREWHRHEGEPWRVLRRSLRERFLQRHTHGLEGVLLELGPGPGRFTAILRRRPRRSVVGLDLSRKTLQSARRRNPPSSSLAPVHWVRGAGEFLPIAPRSVDSVVAIGNIVSFAATDGPALLREIARVLRPGGLFLADFATPVAATQEFFHVAAERRTLGRVLRRRRFYLIDQVLATGLQPYAPHRLGRWEFKFYTAEEASQALSRAGFRVQEIMSIAPVARMDNRIIAAARRDKRAWQALLEVEERVGHRPGVLETGDGFLVAAIRDRKERARLFYRTARGEKPLSLRR